MVLARWSLVGTTTVNLVKTSVSTSMFSLPSDAGSSTVKSMASMSRGLVAMMLVIGVLTGR